MAPGLFGEQDNIAKVCKRCGRRITRSSEHDYCRDCLKDTIFPEVREYVRKNSVSEYELSEIFGIEREMIHDWIVEGHLEYKK